MNRVIIIGRGESSHSIRKPIECVNESQVVSIYGRDSELHRAYVEAINLGLANITVMNCKSHSDMVNIADHLSFANYDYVLPVFNFFESYIPLLEDSERYVIESYSSLLENLDSVVIGTSNHASEYEDISQFIKLTRKNMNAFKRSTRTRIKGENLLFIANNLDKFKFANIALAAALCAGDLSKYPNLKTLGDVTFDLTASDFKNHPVCFFAYDINFGTTIENLYNFLNITSPRQYVPVSLVCRKIEKSLLLEQYRGRNYTPYIKISIESEVSKILNSFNNDIIRNYKILGIEDSRNISDGTVNILIKLSVVPIHSLEEIRIERRL